MTPGHGRFGGGEVAPVSLENARVAVLPVEWESAPSYGKGAGQGSRHILRASAELEALDEISFYPWADLPIHTLPLLRPPPDPRKAMDAIARAAAAAWHPDRFLLTLGGDHSVTIGVLEAAAERWPDAGILQIDAHLDLRDEWNGSRYNHACVMRRAADMGFSFVQAGIRAIAREEMDFLGRNRMRPFFAHDIDPADDVWISEIICALPPTIYISLDLDGLDPSVIPGTGTPEPDGLSFRQVRALIREAGRRRRIIGADITELAKIPGTRASEFTAARLAVKLILAGAAPGF
ncbi:MAG: agmatinase [Desulfobacterales bacterium]|nr:MAG: agmatinase [Desulfobacterales bacterium]